jgi:hypothetical protein
MFPCPRCVWRCKIAFAGVFLVWVIRRPPHGNSQRPLPLHAACSHPSRATRQCTARRRYSKLPEAFPSFPPLLHTLHACLLHPCPPSVLLRMIAFSLFLPPSMPVTPPECASSAQPWGRIESAVCRSRGAQVPPLTCCGGVLSRVGGGDMLAAPPSCCSHDSRRFTRFRSPALCVIRGACHSTHCTPFACPCPCPHTPATAVPLPSSFLPLWRVHPLAAASARPALHLVLLLSLRPLPSSLLVPAADLRGRVVMLPLACPHSHCSMR